MRPEYDATVQLYSDVDDREKKLRSFDLNCCRSAAWLSVSKVTRRVVVISNSCRLRWCPLCSKRKARIIADSVTEWVKKHKHPKILTLTLKHSPDSLDLQITRLYACFRQLRRQKYYKKAIAGGIWFFQVKWIEKTQAWHPHLHCLMQSDYIPHEYLKSTWHAITGDSDIVDIRVIYKIRTAAEYVARYTARPAQLSEMPRNRRLEVYDSLRSRRLCGKWGTASEISFSHEDSGEIGDYVFIARYWRMATHVKKSLFARVLWDCYTTGECVPLCWSLDELDPYAPPKFEPIVIEPPPKSKQLSFHYQG